MFHASVGKKYLTVGIAIDIILQGWTYPWACTFAMLTQAGNPKPSLL
jgi:hypothetical protein